MNKVLDLNRSVSSLCEEYPELIDIMVSLGFKPIADPEVRNTAGRIMTIPKGAEMMNISFGRIKEALENSGFVITSSGPHAEDVNPAPKGHEAGHVFLARMGKTRLRPGGINATEWLLEQADIGKDTKVLEVACNMGTTMIQIAERYGCQVTGLDLDADALENAKNNIRKHHLEDKISVVQGSAFELPFEDESFDVVINEAMLTMLLGDQKDRAISEYARVLKPGGILLTQDVCLHVGSEEERTEITAGISRTINVHVEPLTSDEWKKKFERYGFQTLIKMDDMSLLDPEGLIRDEGAERTSEIISNGTKPENTSMFMGMFEFFNNHKKELGYIAAASRKSDTF
ncbi:MAG: methyltransferase domain-containing protein [Eubacterium sp.]